jgi:bacterioferritin-associated ferredoxin
MVERPPEPNIMNLKIWKIGDFEGLIGRGGEVYTDGAGPAGRLTRAGANVYSGMVAIRKGVGVAGPMISEWAAICCEVPGRQTVPRAETWALAVAAANAPRGQNLNIGVDASYVINGCKNNDRLMKGRNGDLWHALAGAVSEREGPLTVRKVAAHLVEKGADVVLESKAARGDVIGNEMADKAATLARQLSGKDVTDEEASFAYHRALKILKRLAVIQVHVWDSREGARVYEPVGEFTRNPLSIREAISEAACSIREKGHFLLRKGVGHECTRCRRWRRNIHAWGKIMCDRRLNATQLVAKNRLARGLATSLKRGSRSVDSDGVEGHANEVKRKATGMAPPETAAAASESGERAREDLREGAVVEPLSRRADLDDADCNRAMDEEAEEAWAAAAQCSAEAPFVQPPAEFGGGEAAGAVGQNLRNVRRRLNVKTPAEETAYGKAEFLTYREAEAASQKRRGLKRKWEAEARATRQQAWRIIAHDPNAGLVEQQAVNDSGSNDAQLEGEDSAGVHATHQLKEVPGSQVAYCCICAAWTSGRRLRNLSRPCRGETKQPNLLRLLQLGVDPTQGARIPAAELRRHRARGKVKG